MQKEEVRRKWEPHIGKFVLSFTAIEHFLTIAIDVLSRKKISKTARTLPFEKRAGLLIELLENSDKMSKNTTEKIKDQLAQALELSRNVRNIIAHNHILMELYKNSGDGNINESEYIISSRNRNKKISLASLVKSSKRTESLANEISSTYLEMLDEFWRK